MTIALAVAGAWLAIACPAAVLIGRAIHHADHTAPRPPLHLARP